MFYWYPKDFWSKCNFDSVGYNYDGPVCYHIEAFRHAQSAFIMSFVILQTLNATICRSIAVSSFQHVFCNWNLNFAYFVEVSIFLLILYVPTINFALGTRPLRIEHITPNALWFLVWFTYAEFTKYLIRNVKNPDGTNGFFYEWFYY